MATTQTLQITLDEGPVAAFAAYTGDRSALHTDAEYGRRSMYGANVAHGMLPILFLSRMLPPQARLTRMRGQFLRPIPVGSTVTLSVTPEPAEGGERKFLYEVKLAGTVVTRGSVYTEDSGEDVPVAVGDAREGAPAALAVEEANLALEEIHKGMRESLPFRWGAAQGLQLRQLIGADGPLCDPGAFAAAAMLSTLVGMRMPGRTATFKEFEIGLAHRLMDGPATLEAEVSFISRTVDSITQDIRILAGDLSVGRGKVVVQVARPPMQPPSMSTLAMTNQGSGLKDKVVLITGASRGIGATTAKLFALQGARVAINHRASVRDAEAVAGDIRGHGGQALVVQADVTDREAVKRMVEEINRAWGPVDVLVNNAASNFSKTPFLATDWSQVQADLDVIVKGAFNTCQEVIPGFLAKGEGRIVNLSSVAAEIPPPEQSKYVVAKSALNGLTRALAVEYADRNIRVNMVVPSFVVTNLTRGHNPADLGRIQASTPMKRLASTMDVAEAIVFLASARAGFTTGQKLMVTGGQAPFL